MTSTQIQKPARVQRALERLDRAMGRLEAAAAARVEAPASDTASAAELEAARNDNARLREANETVTRRLEQTILRLRSVLGE